MRINDVSTEAREAQGSEESSLGVLAAFSIRSRPLCNQLTRDGRTMVNPLLGGAAGATLAGGVRKLFRTRERSPPRRRHR